MERILIEADEVRAKKFTLLQRDQAAATEVVPLSGVILKSPVLTLAVATGTAQKMIDIPVGMKVTKVIHVQGTAASDKVHTMTIGDQAGSTTGPTGSTGDVDGWDTSVDAAGAAGTEVVGDGAYAASAANIGLAYTVAGSIYAVHTVTAGPATTGTHYLVVHGYM
jgi:hypothetical protein